MDEKEGWSPFFVPQHANHDKESERGLYERGSSVQVDVMTKRPLPNDMLGCPRLLDGGVSRRSAHASALSEIQDSFRYIGTCSDVTKLCNGRICIKRRGETLRLRAGPLTSLEEATVIRPRRDRQSW